MALNVSYNKYNRFICQSDGITAQCDDVFRYIRIAMDEFNIQVYLFDLKKQSERQHVRIKLNKSRFHTCYLSLFILKIRKKNYEFMLFLVFRRLFVSSESK